MKKHICLLVYSLTATLVVGFFSSCSTRTCQPGENLQHTSQNAVQTVTQEAMSSKDTSKDSRMVSENQNKKIKVYKLDGSKQCEQGTGVAVTEMAKELVGIKIYKSEKKHDGLLRIQVCGQPTGECNIFEISETDFSKAEKLGFKKWKND